MVTLGNQRKEERRKTFYFVKKQESVIYREKKNLSASVVTSLLHISPVDHERMTGALKRDDTFRENQVFVSHTGPLICLLCASKGSSVNAYHCKDK